MKKKIYIALFLICCFHISAQLAAQEVAYSGLFTLDSKNPVVTLTSPNEGSFNYLHPMYGTYEVTEDTLGPLPITIGISVSPAGNFILQYNNQYNFGHFYKNLPPFLTSEAKIHVIVKDFFGNTGSDCSDNFLTFYSMFQGYMINLVMDSKKPDVSVISPTGGEEFYNKVPLEVQWSANDDSFGPLPISISMKKQGDPYILLNDSLVNTGDTSVMPLQIVADSVYISVAAIDSFGNYSKDISGTFKLHQHFTLGLSALMEGPFNGIMMDNTLNTSGLLPLAQPYFENPWKYFGNEQVALIPHNDIVDWVLVDLRDASEASNAGVNQQIDRRAAFILIDGSIVDLDGWSRLSYDLPIADSLYVVVWHRNHLGVMSAFSPNYTNGSYSFDFTTAEENAYGGWIAHKKISADKYGMISGDFDANRIVDTLDISVPWINTVGHSGYLQSDGNLNGQADNTDKNDYFYPNVGKQSQVPE